MKLIMLLALSSILPLTGWALDADADLDPATIEKPKTTIDQKTASQAILNVVTENNKVEKLGFGWRDTYPKFIGPAKEAYRNKDYSKAEEMAKKGLEAVELGMEQYRKSQTAQIGR